MFLCPVCLGARRRKEVEAQDARSSQRALFKRERTREARCTVVALVLFSESLPAQERGARGETGVSSSAADEEVLR